MEGEDAEPMLRPPLAHASGWKRWSLAVAATALVALVALQRSSAAGPARSGSGSADVELYLAGYKQGVRYRVCNVDMKECLTVPDASSQTLGFAPFDKAHAFLIGGSRTAIILGDTSKARCVEANSSQVTLQHCNQQIFHVPAVHMTGTIRSDSGHCLQAVKDLDGSIKVQSGPCIGPGTTWLVGEVPEFYQSGTRYKICNVNTQSCVSTCKHQQACEASEVFLVNQSEAAEFVIRDVRNTQEVTTLALADNPEICIQTKGFGNCNGACALKQHSSIVFEKCQTTMQNFYLPFPPLSYGRLRWAMHDDRCVTALPPNKVQMFPCDHRAPIFWQLVPS